MKEEEEEKVYTGSQAAVLFLLAFIFGIAVCAFFGYMQYGDTIKKTIVDKDSLLTGETNFNVSLVENGKHICRMDIFISYNLHKDSINSFRGILYKVKDVISEQLRHYMSSDGRKFYENLSTSALHDSVFNYDFICYLRKFLRDETYIYSFMINYIEFDFQLHNVYPEFLEWEAKTYEFQAREEKYEREIENEKTKVASRYKEQNLNNLHSGLSQTRIDRARHEKEYLKKFKNDHSYIYINRSIK